MSLLDAAMKAIREQLPRIEAETERGLVGGLQRARDWVNTSPDAGTPELRGAMLEALDRVEITAPSLAHITGHNLTAVLERVFAGVGASDDTRKLYFRTRLGYEEARQAMQNRTLEKLKRQLAKEESWDDFVEMLEDIGQMALRVLVPVILAAI